jgi:hypothetical protein
VVAEAADRGVLMNIIQAAGTMQTSVVTDTIKNLFELYSVDVSTISIRSRVWLRLIRVRTGSTGCTP